MKSFKTFLAEGGLDVTHIVATALKKHGIDNHHIEHGGKHSHAVYHVNGREHRFPFSAHGKFDGPIRHEIARSVKYHVMRARGELS